MDLLAIFALELSFTNDSFGVITEMILTLTFHFPINIAVMAG